MSCQPLILYTNITALFQSYYAQNPIYLFKPHSTEHISIT